MILLSIILLGAFIAQITKQKQPQSVSGLPKLFVVPRGQTSSSITVRVITDVDITTSSNFYLYYNNTLSKDILLFDGLDFDITIDELQPETDIVNIYAAYVHPTYGYIESNTIAEMTTLESD
jgi:hypothetical protein